MGSWNIRWFPDGVPGRLADPRKTTDIPWLACAVAYMRVDVLALQEIKTHRRARRAMGELLSRLGTLTRDVWKVRLDTCGGPLRRHTGILWNSRRARGRRFRNVGPINPMGSACAGIHPPGLGGVFSAAGRESGRFHFISVHLEPGTERRSYRRRQKSWRSIPAVYRDAQRVEKAPVVLAGDWNAEGCAGCEPGKEAQDEYRDSFRMLNGLRGKVPSFVRPEPDLPCSWHRLGRQALLDFLLVSGDFPGSISGLRTRVTGYCEQVGCGQMPRPPAAHVRLSDHCPVILDLPVTQSR